MAEKIHEKVYKTAEKQYFPQDVLEIVQQGIEFKM